MDGVGAATCHSQVSYPHLPVHKTCSLVRQYPQGLSELSARADELLVCGEDFGKFGRLDLVFEPFLKLQKRKENHKYVHRVAD